MNESELPSGWKRGSGPFAGQVWNGKKWIADPDYSEPQTATEALPPLNGSMGASESGEATQGVQRFESAVTLLHAKAQDSLAKTLMPGESVLVIIRGPSAQAIIGTDRRAFIYKKGFMAGASFGSEMTNWTYKNLVGVQLHTGMMSGAVVLQGPGQSGTSTSYWKGGNDDPYKAPNAIPVVRPYDVVEAGVSRLRELIDLEHQKAHAPVAEKAGVASMADEIRKLAEMRRDGLITDEEFADLKSQLTGR